MGGWNLSSWDKTNPKCPWIKPEYVPAVNEYIQPYIKAIECESCGIDMETKGMGILISVQEI